MLQLIFSKFTWSVEENTTAGKICDKPPGF